MFTFSRTGNVVKVTIDTLDDEVVYMSPDSTLHYRDEEIYITQGDNYEGKYPLRNAFIINPLQVNGRPADDIATVTQWLVTNYFSGQDYTGGGGSWPADYATDALQTSQLAKLVDIDDQLTELNTKTASSLVSEIFDEKEFVYLGNGDIDYISYKLSAVEVARVTFTYNGNGDLTNLVKT